MKPEKIILLRHGQSQGNVDKSVYATIPDYALQLSETGRKQAYGAAQALGTILAPGSVQYYISPYWRTRQTYQIVAGALGDRPTRTYEDPRLREQEWSGDYRKLSTPDDYAAIEDRRDSYGHFYFRLEGGESCADVFDRISDFLGTMNRDFEKRDFSRNVIIVTHGMTMRLFLMRWFHMSVEEFEVMANPLNCEFYVLSRSQEGEHYHLATAPRLHKVRHSYQFPEAKPNEVALPQSKLGLQIYARA